MTLRVLALDASLARCSAAVVADRIVLAQRSQDAARGHASLLPVMARDVLTQAGNPTLSFVAVTVGPGSFTGIRAGLALAHGMALALGIPVIAVTVGEALAAALPSLPNRTLWIATDSRRDRVFLEIGDAVAACDLASLPTPTGPIAIAGDAAIQVAARLAARDCDVMLTNARLPAAWAVAAAGSARFAGQLPPRDAQPLYVDPPEAKLPAGGLRPAPAA
jgi:tRNA threonylcarbamoyladenosine biosynthesis protein TsaB